MAPLPAVQQTLESVQELGLQCMSASESKPKALAPLQGSMLVEPL